MPKVQYAIYDGCTSLFPSPWPYLPVSALLHVRRNTTRIVFSIPRPGKATQRVFPKCRVEGQTPAIRRRMDVSTSYSYILRILLAFSGIGVVKRCRIEQMECCTPVLHDNVCDNGNGPENLAILVNLVVELLLQDAKVHEPTTYSLPTGSCL